MLDQLSRAGVGGSPLQEARRLWKETMAPRFVALAKELREELASFEPALFSGRDCAGLAEALASTEKACAAAKARAAARAAACGAHRDRGFGDPEDWLARTSGSSTHQARSDLKTAQRLDDCPATKQAVLDGDLSMDEASEITRTEAECPGSEDELLGTATKEGLGRLKEKARKKRQETIDPEELRAKQQKAREFRHFIDELGMVQLRGGLLPEIGIPFCNRLDAETDRLRRQARSEGRHEPRSAHAHDAFAAMLEGHTTAKAKGAELVIVCDLRAYRRGHAHDGEPCHLLGGGPIPVSLAKELSKDAFLKAVLHDGIDISTVCHLGRHITAALRTALELGAPPDFDGVTCSVEGCGRRYGLEWDHEDPVANEGPTSFDNLKHPKCWPHHQEKTARDRKAGLLDGAIKRLEERAPP
ncbi:MAG: DUF222 domain-containing protein [Actinobacteria bacterium]|nr:MAG: DUF222 domain-containing protein [Actinomycetota bacterium]